MTLILSGTNGVSDVDGTAATPAVRGSDTNTGIFFPAADTIAFAEGGAESARFDASGNLGIGTSTPASRLHVNSDNESIRISGSFNPSIRTATAGTNVVMALGAIDNQRGYVGTLNNFPVTFIQNDSERARINSSGNFGVGTSSPDGIIEAYRAAGTAQWSIRATNSVVTGGSGFWQRANGQYEMVLRDTSNNASFITNGTADLSFYPTGGFACNMGSGSDIVQFFQNRNGSSPYWYFNTSGGYGVFSDARLKENIVNTEQADSVEFIKNLQVVEFNWKSEFGDNTRRISGFLAQNVLASAKTEGQKNILTNWETYDEADPECPKMGLSDHRVIPSVVQALQSALATIQEQQAIIEQLKADVAILKGQA